MHLLLFAWLKTSRCRFACQLKWIAMIYRQDVRLELTVEGSMHGRCTYPCLARPIDRSRMKSSLDRRQLVVGIFDLKLKLI